MTNQELRAVMPDQELQQETITDQDLLISAAENASRDVVKCPECKSTRVTYGGCESATSPEYYTCQDCGAGFNFRDPTHT